MGAFGLRAALRRGGHRVPGVPDLSQLRLGLLADLGPGAAGRRAAVLRRLPRAHRASAGRGVRRGARARWATRRRGSGWRSRSSPSASWSPASTASAAPRSRPGSAPSPRCWSSAAWTTRSWPRAATSTSRTWRWSPGPRRWRPRSRAAAAPSGSSSPSPASYAPKPGSSSAPTGSGATRPSSLEGQCGRTTFCRVIGRTATVAPVLWALTDLLATGDALFSLRHTSSLANDLQRTKPASEAPGFAIHSLTGTLKWPVLVGALLGLVLALAFARRRAAVLLALTASGLVTFGADRRRRPLGHRPLPRRHRARAAGLRRLRDRRASPCCPRTTPRAARGSPRRSPSPWVAPRSRPRIFILGTSTASSPPAASCARSSRASSRRRPSRWPTAAAPSPSPTTS